MHKPKIKKILFTLQKKFEPLKKKKFFLIRETTCSLLKYLFSMGAKKKKNKNPYRDIKLITNSIFKNPKSRIIPLLLQPI